MLYIPILRAKKGEAEALANLQPATRAQIRPLLLIPPPNKVVVKQGETRPLHQLEEQRDERYMRGFADKLQAMQGEDGGMWYYLDPVPSQLSPEMLHILLAQLVRHSVAPCPVLYLSGSLGYWRQYIELFGPPRSVLIRIKREQIADEHTPAQVSALIEQYSLQATEVIVMIDSEDVSNSDVGMNALSVATLGSDLDTFPNVTIAIAGGAFPSNPSDPNQQGENLKAWQPYYFPRKDFAIWKRANQRLKRPAIYSDYGAAPAGTAPDVLRRPAPKVRYTMDNHYLLYRGTTSAAEDIPHDEQYQRISKFVYRHDDYAGSHFSWGDKHIFLSQDTLPHNRGGAAKWVSVNTNHHIEHVVATLANQP